MIIEKNEKVFIMIRRQFDSDLFRHFAGVVEDSTEGIIRVTGYAFNLDRATGEFVRRKDRRTRLFGIGGAGIILNILPENVELESLRYKIGDNGRQILTDDHGFEMNISEFGTYR